MKVGLEQAVFNTQEYFKKQCGNIAQAYWEVLDATEHIPHGVYVIACREKCCFDPGGVRTHEVWINPSDGKVCHTHRLPDDFSKLQGNQPA